MIEWLKKRSGRVALALIVTLIAAGLAFSFPADIAFLMALDLSTWVEAAVAVYVTTQVTRIRPALMFVRTKILSSGRRSARQRRMRASRIMRQPQNDDGPAILLLAA